MMRHTALHQLAQHEQGAGLKKCTRRVASFGDDEQLVACNAVWIPQHSQRSGSGIFLLPAATTSQVMS